MQVQSINFTSSRFTPEALEARAIALEKDEEPDFGIKPEFVADVLDGKLRKTKAGRKLINSIVSLASFAAAAISFKKIAPTLRRGIGAATSKIAGKIGRVAQGIKSDGMNQIAEEMSKEASRIGASGDGTIIQKTAQRLLGEQKGAKVVEGLKQFGIKTGGDIADTAIAVGGAVLAGREAGDIANETQEDHTLRSAIGDITKVASALSAMDIPA